MSADVASVREEEFETWLTPSQALALLEPRVPRDDACIAIMDAVGDDIARSAAKLTIIRHEEKPEIRHRFPELPSHVWHKQPPTPRESFWTTAKIDLPVTLREGEEDEEEVELGCHGVRFEKAGILEILEDAGGPPPKPVAPLPDVRWAHLRGLTPDQSTAGKHARNHPEVSTAEPSSEIAKLRREIEELRAFRPTKSVQPGGRPPKPFWDDMWAAIALQMYRGDLKPRRQAEIETAMASWLEDRGHTASEAALRDRARALWREWQAEETKN